MAKKTVLKPAVKSAAKASAQVAKPKPQAKKSDVKKPVAKVVASPVKEAETAKAPRMASGMSKPGWCTALRLWWAFSWRYMALGIAVWLLIGLAMYGAEKLLIANQMSLTLNTDTHLYRLFQLAFSEYVRFMVTWVVMGLLVWKREFRGFGMNYIPAGKTEHSTALDGVVPLAWSVYWRLMIVRVLATMTLTFATLALMQNEAAFKTVLTAVGITLEFAPRSLVTPQGLAVLAGTLLLMALYSVIQVAVLKNLITRNGYKKFNLTVTSR